MPSFEEWMALVLFVSAVVMLIALLGAARPNRLLGYSLLAMAASSFAAAGLHFDRLRDGSMIAVLNALTGALWLVAGVVSLRKRAA